MKLVNLDVQRPEKRIIEGFRGVSVATAHEAMGRKGYLDPAIRQFYPGMKLCGPAVTCECLEMDNLTLHAAIHVAQPGDVIICTMGNYEQQGPFGDCLATLCMARGIEGLVLDSCARDGETINEMGFPVFCKGHCVNGTNKERFGTVNNPIAIGGQVVRAGDIVIGDDDGVVVVPAEIAEDVLRVSLERLAKEVKTREMFQSGIDSWTKNNFGDKARRLGYDVDI